MSTGKPHNQRVREEGSCNCPCHAGRLDLCDCGDPKRQRP